MPKEEAVGARSVAAMWITGQQAIEMERLSSGELQQATSLTLNYFEQERGKRCLEDLSRNQNQSFTS